MKKFLVFMAWEHSKLDQFVRLMVVNLGGDGAQVPVWTDKMGYDPIYALKITRRPGRQAEVVFSMDHEELNGLSKEFPSPTQ